MVDKEDAMFAKARWELRHGDEELARAQDTGTNPDPAVVNTLLGALDRISDWSIEIAEHNKNIA